MKSTMQRAPKFGHQQVRGAMARWIAPCGVIAALSTALLAAAPANAAERSLAGIKIFASVKQVLKAYGNPSQILTDAQMGGTTAGGGNTVMGTVNPGDGGPVPPMMRKGRASEFGGGPMSGLPSADSAANGTDNASSAAAGLTPGEVMYVYRKGNGTSLQFLLSPDGRVIQITLLGYHAVSKTARGIALGSAYSTVIGKYGYPEGQATSNGVLTMKYLNKQNVAFNLNNNKVVGITVAAVE